MTGGPGPRRLDHVGIVVPDLEAAIRWFEEALEARTVLRHGPYGISADPAFQPRQFRRHPTTTVVGIAVVQLGGAALELLEFDAPDQGKVPPRSSDLGGHHLAFYVDDMDSVVHALRCRGVDVLGDPMPLPGPESGRDARFIYLLSPWGLVLELVSYPYGKAGAGSAGHFIAEGPSDAGPVPADVSAAAR